MTDTFSVCSARVLQWRGDASHKADLVVDSRSQGPRKPSSSGSVVFEVANAKDFVVAADGVTE